MGNTDPKTEAHFNKVKNAAKALDKHLDKTIKQSELSKKEPEIEVKVTEVEVNTPAQIEVKSLDATEKSRVSGEDKQSEQCNE